MPLARRALLATPFIAAATRANAQPAEWDKVVEAANKQGHLNLTHNIPPPLGDQWVAEFNKEFPKIAVEATRLGSSELMQRFNTEYPSGASQTDACLTLWDDTLLTWSANGWVKTWKPPEAAAFDPKYVIHDQLFVIQVIRSSLASSKTKVKEADAPKEWTDFFNPKWKDKIGMDPPWRSVAVQQMLAVWHEQGMKDVAQRLRENGVRFFNGSAGVVQALIRGDIWVAAVIEAAGRQRPGRWSARARDLPRLRRPGDRHTRFRARQIAEPRGGHGLSELVHERQRPTIVAGYHGIAGDAARHRRSKTGARYRPPESHPEHGTT